MSEPTQAPLPFSHILQTLAHSCGLKAYKLVSGYDYDEGDRIKLEHNGDLEQLFTSEDQAHIWLLGYRTAWRRAHG